MSTRLLSLEMSTRLLSPSHSLKTRDEHKATVSGDSLTLIFCQLSTTDLGLAIVSLSVRTARARLASEPPEEEKGNSGSEPERSAESATELGTYGIERGVESAMELGTYGIERGAESAMELGTNEMANESPCRGGISCTAIENPRAEVRC